jgi:hypothetical protein
MALVTGEELADNLDIEYSGAAIPTLDQVADAASLLIGYLITATALDDEPSPCKEAAMSVAVEMFQARSSAGGEAVSMDFTPGPYRLSVWLTRRVMGVIAPYLDMKGVVG